MRTVVGHVRGNLVAYLALLVAMGGTGAYAADKIGSGQIAKNAIKGKHIKNGAVTGADVRDDGLTGVDIQESSLTGVPFPPQVPEPPPNSSVTPEKFGTLPAVSAFGTANVTVADQTGREVPFDAEIVDTASMHTTATGCSLTAPPSGNCAFVAPIDGMYAISAEVQWAQSSDGYRQLSIGSTLGGGAFGEQIAVDVITASSFTALHNLHQSVSGVEKLQAGDYVFASVFADVSSPSTTIESPGPGGSPHSPHMSVTWLGPG